MSQGVIFSRKYLSFTFSSLLISSSNKAEEGTGQFWKHFLETILVDATGIIYNSMKKILTLKLLIKITIDLQMVKFTKAINGVQVGIETIYL